MATAYDMVFRLDVSPSFESVVVSSVEIDGEDCSSSVITCVLVDSNSILNCSNSKLTSYCYAYINLQATVSCMTSKLSTNLCYKYYTASRHNFS